MNIIYTDQQTFSFDGESDDLVPVDAYMKRARKAGLAVERIASDDRAFGVEIAVVTLRGTADAFLRFGYTAAEIHALPRVSG